MGATIRRAAICGFCVALLGSVLVGFAQPARAAATLTPIRQIGGSGHAALYGWGAATMPDGSVVIGDYWNYRIQHYAKNGNLLGTVVPRNSSIPHAAPYGIGVDPVTGDIYFGDVDSGATVDKYSATGTPLLQFGGQGTGANKFRYPRGVAVASDRTVFVSDARGNAVSAHNPNGTELYSYSGSQSPNPRGIAVDASDRVFVADSQLRKVQVFNKNLQYQYGFGNDRLGGDLRGVAIDQANGWVYVADAGSSRIYKYTLSGTFLLSFGANGSGNGQFSGGPRDLTVDGDGNVWVGDMPNFRAQKFSPGGTFLMAVPSPPEPPPDGGFTEPRDVAVDGAGNTFVADTHNWRMQKFDASGQFTLAWGSRGGGNSQFNYQKGVMVDRNNGSVYVCDTDSGKVKKFTNSGVFVWAASGPKCWGGAVAPNGDVYVADTQGGKVVVLSANSGAQIRQVAGRGSGNGKVSMPTDVAIDSDGSIWVADKSRNDVQHLSSTGAYLGKLSGQGLNQTWGVAVYDGHVFVASSGSNQIKIWTTSGAFVTSYGSGGSTLGRFQGPKGLDVSDDGHLYVVEHGGERVQELRITGT
ncbi:MAG: hypothetical protein K1X95_06850 [Acidimicrobiia bacterium]|nr:hypothetical protein [Acidimicrobiia bacterium]